MPSANFICNTESAKTIETKHETGIPLTVSFCGDCGTSLWKTGAPWPDIHIVFAGALDEKDALEKAKPDAELWIKYRSDWVKEIGKEGMQCEEFPSHN